MINSRDSYNDFAQNKKYSIEFPYCIGTIVESKDDPNILAEICQYRIIVEGYTQIINVGLNYNIYSRESTVEHEITVDELEERWKKTDSIIVVISNQDPVLKSSTSIPSNDSISSLLQGFKYDTSKTSEVLKEHQKLTGENKGPVKSLKK